jgi:hypothetical protein
MNLPLRARQALLALSLALVASGCGTKKADESSGEVTIVPRPPSVARSDAGTSPPRPTSCVEEDECRPGQSCTGTCGVHQLGDTSCSCMDNSLSCAGCVLNPAYAGMLQDATAFCPAGVQDRQPCTAKGATCIAYDADIDQRSPCLCWRGKTGLEWDCDDDYPPASTPAFFKDRAPPTDSAPQPPGGSGPFGNPKGDAGPPPAPDASAP